MMLRQLFTIISLMLCVAAYTQPATYNKDMIKETRQEFFVTAEASRIGEQILLWQRCTGGWPKNIDMVTPMTEKQRSQVMEDKQRRDDSTIDNGATTTQIAFIARLFHATGEPKYREAFGAAMDYLIAGQYDNGGWPQFWPEQKGYHAQITYNDDAMVNTMEIIRDIYECKAPYDSSLCSPSLRKRLKRAFDKGVECILATQIRVDAEGKVLDPIRHKSIKTKKGERLTVWCQQHDRETLLPTKARAYELPSFCVLESAKIVRLLMSLPNPDQRVKTAIHSAMAWFDKYKLTGVRIIHINDDGGKRVDTKLINDTSTQPLWGRFYDLESCTPFVCDRDGIPRQHLEDIGTERRNSYSWYGSRPASLYKLYDEWADKYDAKNKVNIDLMSKGNNKK